VLPTLIPDPVQLAEILEEAPEVPLAFLKEQRPTVPWSGPSAYLRLSEAYDAAAEDARERGWPVSELDLHHLAAATHPEQVAAALVELLSRL
jgi:hypothetical protein